MNSVVVAIVAAVAVVCLAILLAAVLWKGMRNRSSKFDTVATERERFLGAEIEASDTLPQITKLATVQPKPINEIDENGSENDKGVKSLCAYLYFTIKYDEKKSKLVVKLVKGENVPVQKSYLSKPYVEVRVMPVQTKPTHSPQGIEFKIAPDDVFRQTVHFCICRYDKYSRKITIGDVFLSLAELSADQVDISNEVFLKILIEPNVEIKTINEERSAKDLWRKLRDAVRSGKFVRQMKRKSFVEEVEWEKTFEFNGSKPGDGRAHDDYEGSFDQVTDVKEIGGLGTLFFSLKYNETRSVLVIRIMKATDIPDDHGQPPNVMVEGAVISGAESEKEPFRTLTQVNSFTPVFDEAFEFRINYEDLWKKTIHFLVWYIDDESRLSSLGKVVYSLSDLDIKGLDISETAMLFSEDIAVHDSPRDVPSDDESSSVLFSLTYLPATKRLVVLVLKAKDLKPTEDCRGIFIEVTIYHKNQRYRKTTGFKTEHNNPVFNETLLFDLNDVIINDVRLQVKACQKNTMGSNIPLAKCNLGKEVGGSEESHWLEALTAAKPIAQWHKLKPIKYVKPFVQGISTMTTKELHSPFGLPKQER